LNLWVTQAVCAALLFAAGTPPEVVQATPPGGPASSIVISPPDLDFGTLPMGTVSAPRTATLANHGTEAVTVSEILTAGIDFAQTNTCGGTLAPGTNCAIEITFKPAIPGLRIGTLNVLDSDRGSPHTIVLSGSGQ
jgi:HYDIN/CFA65/VesB-like, Ig-like domain